MILNKYSAPTAADTLAFIEISDPPYARDRAYKIPLYFASGVPSFIVHIERRSVEWYRSAADLELPNGTVVSYGDSFEILGVRIAIADLFVA